MSHLSHRISPRTSSNGGPYNVYSQAISLDQVVIYFLSIRLFKDFIFVFIGLRGLMSRPRSESAGAQMMKKPGKLKKVQVSGIYIFMLSYDCYFRIYVAGCQLTSVYDLREGDEGTTDLYDDDWAFRRPRSNSSVNNRFVKDFLILRKTSRPLSVDVLGLVDKQPISSVLDSQSDPYRQYMRVVDCYELAPSSGNIIALDKNMKVEPQPTCHKIIEYLNMYVILLLIFEACEEFCLNRVHRILVCEPISGDVLYLLTIKRVLQAIHKQVRWSDSVREAVSKMITHRVSSLPVLDDEEKVIDVIHKADFAAVLRTVTNMQEFLSKTLVSSVLSIRPPCPLILPSDSVGKVLDTLLETQHTRCVFIVDSLGRSLACVSQSDVISHLIYDESPFHKPKSLGIDRSQLVLNN
uniref:CBS domain-containing protein n=1 Tax=Heterorhabditis bacteriophora TaxID=37862 RepID=A0A1I7WZ90_HETBA